MRRGEPLIRIESASKSFLMGEVRVRALEDVDLVIERGDLVCVLGPSGSGKSTLVNLVGGLDRPSSGRILYGDLDLAQLDDEGLARFRRETVGFVFQFYNLVPSLTAEENVRAVTELVDDPMEPAEALRLVGLGDRLEHFPAQLSGGEQQRVAVARALAKRPALLLADEPTGALDLPTGREVLKLLQALNRERDLTIVLITHNSAIAAIATRVVRLASGRIESVEIEERPADASEVNW